MRVTAALPLDPGYFRKLPPTAKWAHIWEHDSSDRLRICANVPNPWDEGQQWEIKIYDQKSKWHGQKKTSRVDLQCHPTTQKVYSPLKARIEIEEQRGGIPHSTKSTLLFYPIPGEDRWVKFSVIAVV